MDNEKLEEIKRILKFSYVDRMTEKTINACAKDLYESLFVGKYSLDDLFAIISKYEEKNNIAGSDDSFYVYEALIGLLDNNEVTAQRLYETAMNMDSLAVFVKLLTENNIYLSDEEISKVKKRAFDTFDKEDLEAYGITENEE